MDKPVAALTGVPALLESLRGTSLRGLRRMYLPSEQMFCHCIRRGAAGDVPEGVSRRYTAIVMIGLATESTAAAGAILDGGTTRDLGDRLLSDVERVSNLGDVALTYWATRLHDHPRSDVALERLRQLDPVRGRHPTVEIAWTLASLSVPGREMPDAALARKVAGRLSSCYHEPSGAFSHWPADASPTWLRRHVSCFADLVYPTQALSYYHQATGDTQSAALAKRCGAFMCAGQGAAGQWWWHFDVRTGRVVEGYPVYAVHQDAMAPMALFALEEACGDTHRDAVERGLHWLQSSVELEGGTLMDEDADLVWRKVARHEPGKLARTLHAAASRIHPGLRAPMVDVMMKPGRIDYECRPYHLGWILHAFPANRAKAWPTSA